MSALDTRRVSDLTDALRLLALCRADAERARSESDSLADAARVTPEYRAFMEARTTQTMAETAVAAASEAVRVKAIEEFEDTREKRPAPGVQIREYRRCEYDQGQALAWCKAFAPTFVQEHVDARAFEKVAETLAEQGAPVRIVREAKATIAGDLRQYLVEEVGNV